MNEKQIIHKFFLRIFSCVCMGFLLLLSIRLFDVTRIAALHSFDNLHMVSMRMFLLYSNTSLLSISIFGIALFSFVSFKFLESTFRKIPYIFIFLIVIIACYFLTLDYFGGDWTSGWRRYSDFLSFFEVYSALPVFYFASKYINKIQFKKIKVSGFFAYSVLICIYCLGLLSRRYFANVYAPGFAALPVGLLFYNSFFILISLAALFASLGLAFICQKVNFLDIFVFKKLFGLCGLEVKS